MNTDFSLAHLTVIDLPPAEMIRVAARCGYTHVGLRLIAVSDTSPGYPLMDDPVQLRKTRAAMAETGVAVRDIEFVKITPDIDVSALEPFFAVGAELRARHVVTSPYDQQLSRLTYNLARIAQLSSQYGISPVMEFFPWTQPVDDLASAIALVEATGDESIGVLVDTLHFNRTDSSLEDLKKLSASRLPFVHVCDAPVQASYSFDEFMHAARVERLPPGKGEIDIRSILNCMAPETPIALEIPMTSLSASHGCEFTAHHVITEARKYLHVAH